MPPRPTSILHSARAWLRCAFLLTWFAAAAPAADVVPLFSQRHWTRIDGLPSNEITALCLDQTGYLWIGMPTGLTRFDGSRFLHYDFAPGGKLTASGFGSIVADPAGDGLWAAPFAGGLIRFRQGRFEPCALPGQDANRRVARLFVAADKALWIAFEGGEVMRLHDGRPEVFGLKEGLGPRRSTHFASDGVGRVWLANGPLLSRYEKGALHPVPLEEVGENIRITSARQDGPWVLTRGWLRKIVDGEVGMKVQVNANFNARSVQALMEDAEGAVWTGTRSRGVRRLTLPDQTSDLALETPEDVGVLLDDGQGNTWVGSNGGGLIRIRAGMVRRFDKTQGLLESHTLGVCEDAAGTMWIANRDGGVAYINEQGRVRTLAAPRGRDTFSVRSVAPDGPEGVLVTTSYGLLRADKEGLVAVDATGSPSQPPAHGEMRITHRARNGDLWIVLEPGRLGRLREGIWRVFTSNEGLGAGAVQAISEDARGRIWVGTEMTELYCLEADRFARMPLPAPAAAGAIQAIHFDAAGTGWIGTAGAGLLRLGATAGRNLTERNGLPSANISQLISDDQGSLWFGSQHGIFKARREDLEKFFAGLVQRVDAAILGADEGLREATAASAHHPSVWKSHDGLLWFATRQGVVAIDPRREQTPGTPLVVKLDAVRAGDLSWPATAAVRVPPLTRTLELDYSVLCLSAPDQVRARVRLDGYEDEWTSADGRGLVRFTRLPPGDYHFILEAHLAGMPGTSARIRVPLVVEAAWWQTLWFRAGVVALVLGLGGWWVRVRSHRRLQARLAQLEQAAVLERERTRIAQNLHDDLGSGLTRISLLTQTGAPDGDRAQLDKIYGTVSDLTQSMDEIVWAVNPKNDNLEGLANYVAEYAQGFLSDAGIRCRVLMPAIFAPHALNTQCRHHLFMACKEALNNVAKHAQATEVSVQIRTEGDRLEIVIADNGCGCAAAPAGGRSGNGQSNMRSRLAALDGTCETTCAAGTTVTLSVSLSSPTNLP